MSKEKLANLEVGQCLGRGVQSQVYKGYDLINKRDVAIKKRVNIKGAQQEVKIMKKYGQHPYLPKLYDYFTYKNRAYIVMEHVDGKPLGRGRKVEKKSEEDAVEITINVLKGLGHLHTHNILHVDTLPKNVMLLPGNNVKIIDFGFSFEKGIEGLYKGERKHKRVTGKPPELREQILLLDDTTDIYAAAYLCVSLLNGQQPKWDKKNGNMYLT
ncbi:serine/threonine protein kinase [Desulfitispora alkaliphila]|uniref:protein kinase domain-containing protein n=1 Tax=Desulfitispora alkaliphila TaxID=622674 RepID=UPI003D1FB4EA